MAFEFCMIYKPRKKESYPIMDISNSKFIAATNDQTIEFFLLPKFIS